MTEPLELDAVLSLVFHGSLPDIQSSLALLSEEARATTFRRSSKVLTALRRCCRRWDENIDEVSMAHLEATARRGVARDLARLRVDDAGRLFVRVQATWVGLAGRKNVKAGMKRDEPVDWEPPMMQPVAAVLLDRPEPWIEEALFEWFENIQRWTAGSQGAVTLLRDLIEQYPDWRSDLEPFVGRWTAIEGFAPNVIGTLPPSMLIAGLLDDDMEVLANPRIYPLVIQFVKAGRLPRQQLVETALDKLRTPMRQGLERAWMDLLATIAPTDAERDQQAERYEELLTAPGSAPARLGLDDVERRLDAIAVDPEHAGRVVGLLAIALEHRVQLVTKQALRLVETLIEEQPAVTATATTAILQALTSPHAALRKKVLAWLKRSTPSSFGADDLALLADVATDLDPEQRSMIDHLLPHDAVLEPESEEPRPPLDIAEILARASRHGADLRPVDRRRVAWLEAFQQQGALPPEARGLPVEPAPVTPFESVAAMLDTMSRASEDSFTALERERLLDGVTRFTLDEPDRKRIRRLFDPELQRVANEFGIDARDFFIALIVHAWAGGPRPDRFSTSNDVDAQRALALAERPDEQAACSLSAMTHEGGWLDPVVFAERWMAEPARSALDLERALYRLARDDERRRQAWALLSDRRDNDFLIIALGPEAEARSALARSTATLPDVAPGQLTAEDESLDLLVDLAYDDSAEEEDSAERRQALIASAEQRDAVHRDLAERAMRFRLVIAALRGRFGLEDARGLCSDEDLERMLRQVETRMRYRDDHQQEVREYLFDHLLFPKRLDPSEFPPDLAFVKIFHDWPAMAPYQMAADFHSVSSLRVERHASQFPPIAQRVFEAGLARLDEAMEYKSSLGSRGQEAPLLLEVAKVGHVEVAAALPDFVVLFSSKFPETRERAIDLALGWLHDGRVLPHDLAGALATLIASVSKGAKYVDEALESIAVTGDAGARVVQMALETVVVETLGALAPRARTLALDRLLAVLDALEDGVRDSAARARLDELASAKKASAARDRARALIRRTTTSDLPLAVESLAHLLDASVADVE